MEKKLLKDSFVNNALRKQVPQRVTKTPFWYGNTYSCSPYGYRYGCPCCDNFISSTKNSTIRYCNHCGQALDWSKA